MAVTWKKLAYEDDVITKGLLDAAGDIIYASGDNTPARLAVGANDDVLTLAAGIPSWAAPTAPGAHKDSHDPADGSDPLDTAAASEIVGVQAAGVGTSHSLARADHAHQIQHGIADNHLVTVDGAVNQPVDDDIAVFTASGLEGQTPAQVAATMALDDIGVPDAAIDFNEQQATDLVIHNVADNAAKVALTPIIGKMVFQVDELAYYGCTVAA